MFKIWINKMFSFQTFWGILSGSPLMLQVNYDIELVFPPFCGSKPVMKSHITRPLRVLKILKFGLVSWQARRCSMLLGRKKCKGMDGKRWTMRWHAEQIAVWVTTWKGDVPDMAGDFSSSNLFNWRSLVHLFGDPELSWGRFRFVSWFWFIPSWGRMRQPSTAPNQHVDQCWSNFTLLTYVKNVPRANNFS